MDAPSSAMEDMAAIASAPTTTMAATPMFPELTTAADITMPMATAATTMAAVRIMAMLPRITMVPATTDGLTIRGPRPFITDGDGDRNRGMATTVLTSLPIPYIRRRHSGSRIT